MELHLGQTAPEFSLLDQLGQQHRLSDYFGRWVILYFYPKDDTPGCTTEACGMRDTLPHFDNSQATVLGISTDTVTSHAKFAQKFQLNFPILADTDKLVSQQYGVWQTKSMFGKKYMGIVRTTFIISPNGQIVKIYPDVKPDHHAQQVLTDLQNIIKAA